VRWVPLLSLISARSPLISSGAMPSDGTLDSRMPQQRGALAHGGDKGGAGLGA
jgi:hypothetical protein